MKKYTWSLLLAVSLLAGACNQVAESRAGPAAATADTPVMPVNAETAAAQNPAALETISPQEVRINGLSFETTTAALVKTLGKPDRIRTNVVECRGYFKDDKGDSYQYDSTTFEVNNQRAVSRSVDFRSGKFRITIGQQVLDRHTTLDDIRRRYPLAASKVTEWQTTASAGKMYQVVSIRNPGMDDVWQLYFDHGKLVEFEYYRPC